MRWTREALADVRRKIERGDSPAQIAAATGVPWQRLVVVLSYHARKDALEARRASAEYDALRLMVDSREPIAHPKTIRTQRHLGDHANAMLDPIDPGIPPESLLEQRRIADLYKPRAELPPSLRKYAGRRPFG